MLAFYFKLFIILILLVDLSSFPLLNRSIDIKLKNKLSLKNKVDLIGQLRRSNGLKLKYQRNDDSFSLVKTVTLSLAILGIFGTGFFNTFQKLLIENTITKSDKTTIIKPKESFESLNRGSKTRMNRIEINTKLSQIPTFYVVSNDKGIHIDKTTNEGTIFLDYGEAKEYYNKLENKNELRISGSTLDDLYYSLIMKKQKVGQYMSNKEVASSDPSCKYNLKASEKELSQTSESWKTKHSLNDVPIFRVKNLAFTKPEGLEFPLFLRKEDAITSYERLNTQDSNNNNKIMEIQETSLNEIIELFSSGGFETRSLEFYPSIESIEKIREILS